MQDFCSKEKESKQRSMQTSDQIECGHHSPLNVGAAFDESGIVCVPTEESTEVDDEDSKEELVYVIGNTMTD